MILLYCMERPNIFSYDDLAIQRGLRMIYHHRKIDKKLFENGVEIDGEKNLIKYIESLET